MSELILKYERLNDFGKQELLDFLNYLLSKRSINHQSPDDKELQFIKEKNIGNLLKLLNDFTDKEFADNVENQQVNWKNWDVKTW
jgi:hypothetical protein